MSEQNKYKNQKWHRVKEANEGRGEALEGDMHFKNLSKRFWSFAQGSSFAGGEKTLADVLHDFWQARLYISAASLLAGALALGFIFISVPHTRAYMMIGAADMMQAPDVSAAIGNGDAGDAPVLRVLAQRLGGGGESPAFVRFEHIYHGVSVAQALLKDDVIRKGLAQDRAFIFSSGIESMTPERLAAYIDRHVRLSPVKSSALRRLSYFHPDPAFARYFLTQLHRAADDVIRAAVQKDAAARTAYLEKAIVTARNPDHRRSLTVLLMEQERLLMLASTPQPYAASVVEPPAAFYKAEWPDAKLILPLFMCVGALFGFLIYGLRCVSR